MLAAVSWSMSSASDRLRGDCLCVLAAGTPMEALEPPSGLDIARCVATARVTMPQSVVRLSAGRMKFTIADQVCLQSVLCLSGYSTLPPILSLRWAGGSLTGDGARLICTWLWLCQHLNAFIVGTVLHGWSQQHLRWRQAADNPKQ